MASIHIEIKSGAKGTAEKHSRYIAREGVHRHRDDVLFSGHVNLPEWAQNSTGAFWKSSDRYERQKGTAYKELIVALPVELSMEKQKLLVDRSIRELVGIKPFQYAVHAPQSSLQGKTNLHVHIMYSDRLPDGIERPPEQMFSRYNAINPLRGGRRKDSGGRTPSQLRDELIAKRRVLAEIQNEFLRADGHTTRVDHRTLKEQGVERPAERHLGAARIRRMSAHEKAAYVAAREDNAFKGE
jgi:hypothetical protein